MFAFCLFELHNKIHMWNRPSYVSINLCWVKLVWVNLCWVKLCGLQAPNTEAIYYQKYFLTRTASLSYWFHVSSDLTTWRKASSEAPVYRDRWLLKHRSASFYFSGGRVCLVELYRVCLDVILMLRERDKWRKETL